jgi:hypothetical protein
MLPIDANELRELVAPLATPKDPKSYVFERLARPVRIDYLPIGADNSEWLNFVVTKAMKKATTAAKLEEAGEAVGLEVEDADYKAKCHEGVEFITRVRIVGWAVRGDDGEFVKRQYTSALGAQLLHALIDAPHGLKEYMAFTAAINQAEDDEEDAAPDPAATAGNSSGV